MQNFVDEIPSILFFQVFKSMLDNQRWSINREQG
jgi:hypothetical protein